MQALPSLLTQLLPTLQPTAQQPGRLPIPVVFGIGTTPVIVSANGIIPFIAIGNEVPE